METNTRYKTKDMLKGMPIDPNNLENPVLREVLGTKYGGEDGFIYWIDNGTEGDYERAKQNSKDRYGSG